MRASKCRVAVWRDKKAQSVACGRVVRLLLVCIRKMSFHGTLQAHNTSPSIQAKRGEGPIQAADRPLCCSMRIASSVQDDHDDRASARVDRRQRALDPHGPHKESEIGLANLPCKPDGGVLAKEQSRCSCNAGVKASRQRGACLSIRIVMSCTQQLWRSTANASSSVKVCPVDGRWTVSHNHLEGVEVPKMAERIRVVG